MVEGSMAGAGRLLVATPLLPDPNFDRTVVLLLAHSEEGALGVVLNRPSQMGVDSPLPQWERLAAEPRVVFFGGPVAPGAAICLALARPPAGEPTAGWSRVAGPIGTLDLEQNPDDVAGGVAQIRIFAGYAGWGPGQLEREITDGAWFVVDAEPDDAMAEDPEQLWKQVLRRQGDDLALVAAFPADPSSN